MSSGDAHVPTQRESSAPLSPPGIDIKPRELRFTQPGAAHSETNVSLSNPSDSRIAFKVKTTAPRRYCVRPNSGIIEPDNSQSIHVIYQPGDAAQQAEIPRHKFLIQALTLLDDEDSDSADLWRGLHEKSERLTEAKLRVVFPDQQQQQQSSTNLEQSRATFISPTSVDDVVVNNSDVPTTPSIVRTGGGSAASEATDSRRLLEENRRLLDDRDMNEREKKLLKQEIQELRQRLKERQRQGDAPPTYAGSVRAGDTPQSISAAQAMSNFQVQIIFLLVFVLGIVFSKLII